MESHPVRLRNYSAPEGSVGSAPHSDTYQDLEFYSNPPPPSWPLADTSSIKKELLSEASLAIPAGNHLHYTNLSGPQLHREIKEMERNPPPTAEEEISLEDIMALVDPGIGAINGYTVYQHRLVERHGNNDFIHHHSSKLHQALTQPRFTTLRPPPPPLPAELPRLNSGHCTKCNKELSSRCLVQACVMKSSSSVINRSQETKCRDCGQELTAKCILSMCSNNNNNNNTRKNHNSSLRVAT